MIHLLDQYERENIGPLPGLEYEMQMADGECVRISYMLVTSFTQREITHISLILDHTTYLKINIGPILYYKMCDYILYCILHKTYPLGNLV
jgi:hypothetical protein